LENNSKKQSFWNAARIVMLFLFFIGLVIGALIQHYAIEPVLGQTIKERLDQCELENKELYSSLQQCHQQIGQTAEQS